MKNDKAKQEEPAAKEIRIVGSQTLDGLYRFLSSFSKDGFFTPFLSRLPLNALKCGSMAMERDYLE